MIYGEDRSSVIKLQNHGALETEVIIKSHKGNDIQTRTETSSLQSGANRFQNENEEDRQILEKFLSQLKFQKIHIL